MRWKILGGIIAVLVVLAASFLIIGDGGKEPMEEPSPHAGDEWVFKFSGSHENISVTREITGTEILRGENCFVYVNNYEPSFSYSSGISIEKRVMWYPVEWEWVSLREESWGEDVAGATYSENVFIEIISEPRENMLLLEVGEVNQENYIFTRKTSVGSFRFRAHLNLEAVDREDFTVPAGTFDCLKIIVTKTLENGNYPEEESIIWYSDRADSPVKYSKPGGTSELLSYDLKDNQ